MVLPNTSSQPPLTVPVFATKDGVPEEYTQTTSSGRRVFLQKGQLNKLRSRPAIINEQAESSRNAQAVVSAGNIVGQVFRASQDNINSLGITLESAAGISLDDFESYGNSAALQAVWILTGTNLALLETTVVAPGGSTKSMSLLLDTLNDEWQDTIAPTDYTDYTFDFDFRQSRVFTQAKVSFFIGDGANTKSIQLPINEINAWEHFEINENAMSDDGGTPNMAAITEIGFRVDDAAVGHFAYVDNLASIPAPGQVELKLYDFGASSPVQGAVSLDDATQYIEIGDRGVNSGIVAASLFLDLEGGKKLYTVKDFVAGAAEEIPANTLLTPGNYYAFTITYVDTDVTVYGPDETIQDYYVNGYAFTAATTAANIAQIGGGGSQNDLMFIIYSTQDVYVNTFVKISDAAPGTGATEQIYVEDTNMIITNIMVGSFQALQSVQAFFDSRPAFLPKGGKFEIYYNDDFTDNVSVVDWLIGYLYIPPTVYG